MITDMSCDEFVERLGDLLGRDVDETSRAAIESHGLECVECGALLADMRKLRIDAANLPVLTPSHDLWTGIARRIDAPVIPLRSAHSEAASLARPWRRWAPLAAAAVLLVTATATSTYYLTMRGRAVVPDRVASAVPIVADTARAAVVTERPTAVASRRDDSVLTHTPQSRPMPRIPSAGVTARLASTKPSAEQVYSSEIARLRVIVERRRSQLDPITVSVIERNLNVIDDAIAQCKLALAKDPASRFLMESLNSALETKVELLRTATMLPSRSS
ncbi:MAG: hypothetical protein ACJ796_03610 [Gemmatimonadaceae bacterium]